ncbi:hypothetical protein IPT12_14960 [Xanthomonas perforans]|jgi:hypothetical protein|uniref:Uncharacterized protein n=3 Tax=Xanthomonas TaxID=338 RepID=A0A6V7FH52_9XANT|nr:MULTISPECIES: hypothetical protein [Xanthomonas]KLC02075.1 hypothetical protein XP315_21250 [Xanthomonas perforans]KLC11150.1 hypothetical protein XP4B_13465 [Xanthomonas perforans]KLC15460.1 hypothetical protein XP56_16750 [Xanthomonas perforans]KLC36718.1 hypothetical protein XP112_10820 [Xanthomonas perforans]KLC40053.1 hypothetical protein XP95_00780 [Xanthomonas perforans]
MLDFLQKSFAPFSLRSVRTVRPGAKHEWSATICVNGSAVGKLITLPVEFGQADSAGLNNEQDALAQYAMDLCFLDSCHQMHFEQHTRALMNAGILVEDDLQVAMVDLITLMADAYLGDKAMFRLAKEGVTIYRLRSDPLNTYRRLNRAYTPYLGQELKLLHGDVDWVLNERLGAEGVQGEHVLHLVTTTNTTHH